MSADTPNQSSKGSASYGSKDIQVLDSRKGTDGFLHIAVCGASTGAINIFAIKPDDLAVARELGVTRQGLVKLAARLGLEGRRAGALVGER